MNDFDRTGKLKRRQVDVLVRGLLICLIAIAAFSLPSIHAQTNTPSKTLPANRYLLVVETSRAMQKRMDGTLQAIQRLVGSAMHGQMHPGDSLGIWTFNESLYTGKVPSQDWSTESRREIAGRVVNFLQGQTYEKQGRLEKVLPTMMRVVKGSEFVTVVLVTSGSEEIHGTPFDQEINKSFKLWSTQQQDAKMPFVAVLRAQRGNFTGYAVAPVPWPVDFPALPAELQIAKTATNRPPVMAAKSHASTVPVPNLIVSGKKPEPPTVSNSTAQVVSQPPLPTPNLTQESTQDSKAIKAESATNALVAAIKSSVEIVSAPPALAKDNGSEKANGGIGSNLAPGQPADHSVVPQPGQSITQPPATIPEPKPLSQPAASIETNLVPFATKEPPATEKLLQTPSQPAAELQPSIATVAPGRSLSGSVAVAIAAFICLSAGGVFIWTRRRRTRTTSHVSLITRSFEREKM